MKRLSVLGFVGLLAGVLSGCPIFDDGRGGDNSCEGGFFDSNDCVNTGASVGSGPNAGCSKPSDCGVNETCGADSQCHPGDCTFFSCVSGFVCVVGPDQTASCQPGGSTSSTGSATTGSGGAGGAGGATTSSTGGGTTSTSTATTGTGGAGGGGTIYCGNPNDCAAGQTCAPNGTCEPGSCLVNGCIFGYTCDGSGTCKPSNPAACGADKDCLGAGYECVSGICTAPQDECFDGTQCPNGDKCVTGKCTTSCTGDGDCRDGYGCDTNLGVCSKVSKACTITNDCGGANTVCVDGACVPRASGGTCMPGDAWVENGCIPDQKASFICNTDGVQDACAGGSLCLHHACYISCQPPNTNACDNLPSFNVCKSVTTSSGTHQVCGSSSNLGGQCDPNTSCVGGKICIDGFCK